MYMKETSTLEPWTTVSS